MPVMKVDGGYKVKGTNTVHRTKKAAEKQQKAIYANKKKKGRK